MTAAPAGRLLLCGLAALAVACSGSTSLPTPPTSPGPTTTATPQLRAVRLLNAPQNIHMGSSAAARAVAEYADGGFVDVTGTATWRSSGSACKVASGGVIEAVGGGMAEITAEFGGMRSGAASVACGHFITIDVHESFPTEAVAVAGVRGEILDGPLAGYTFATDVNGRAVLPPVGEPGFTVHFKKAGFENYAHRVTQLPNETTIRIPLTPEYTARVSFQGQCSGATFNQRLIDNYRFSTGRTGNIRMRLDTQSDGRAPFSEFFGTIRGAIGQIDEHVSVHEVRTTGTNRPVAEMRVGAGDYQMDLSALRGCSATDSWHVTLEYSR